MSVSDVSSTVGTTAASTPVAASSTGGDGTGPLATQVMQWAGLLADGSGASIEDQANAFASLHAAIMQTGPGGGPAYNDYFQQTTPAQRQQVYTVTSFSDFAKQSQAAYQKYAQQANDNVAKAAGGDIPPSESTLAYVNQLSSDQQQLLFASVGPGGGFSSFSDWKAQLQKDQDTMAADYAVDNGGSASVTVSLSDSAKAALTQSGKAADSSSTSLGTSSGSAPTDADSKALQILSTPSTGTLADVALAVLQSAAQANQAAEATSDTASGGQDGPAAAGGSTNAGRASPDKTYQAGDRVSLTA